MQGKFFSCSERQGRRHFVSCPYFISISPESLNIPKKIQILPVGKFSLEILINFLSHIVALLRLL